MTAGFIEFEFDLPDALLHSLIAIFDKMDAAPLADSSLSDIPDAQGVYQLLLDGQVAYIGKTDGDAGLKQRLLRHASTVQHRKNLALQQVAFKAVRVFVFTAMDLESQLIRHYGSTASLAWNKTGFGSNDPGRNRETTTQKDDHFDVRYPIDIDQSVEVDIADGSTVAALLTALRSTLPYTFRFESDGGSRRPHPELVAATVNALPPKPRSARQLISAALAVLPTGWQATVLAGRIIMYRENVDYSGGTLIGRSA